ncbi:MAG: lantibiotic dehydratase [Pyrinomonadaceae bacterium]
MAESESRLEFTPARFFVFRTPLLPFNEFMAWGDGFVVQREASESSLEEWLAESCGALRERLDALTSRTEAREAIFIACPDLCRFIESWREQPETKRGRNTERALVRYFTRMAGRSTPFGLFAGTSVGIIGKKTSLNTEGRAKFRRRTRLDFNYLLNLADVIAQHAPLKKELLYYPNSSLYRAGGRIRYVESMLCGENRSYRLVAVEETDYLFATLKRANEGAKFIALAQSLVDDEVSLEEAEKYIDSLIESQILVPDLSIPVSGCDSLDSLIAQLRRHEETAHFADALARARSCLAGIDRKRLGVEPRHYNAAAQSLEPLPLKADLSRLFHVDLIKPAPAATLGVEVLEEIVRGIKILHRVTGRPGVDPLARFSDAFTERYGEMEVPLAEALDEESGIGFGAGLESSSLITDMEFHSTGETRAFDDRQEFLLQKLYHALEHGDEEIVLEQADIEKLEDKNPLPLPDSFAAIAKIASASQDALADGHFRVLLEGISGPSGATLFGRFCHADRKLRNHVLRHVRAEQALKPDAVFAEIVHVPEGRAGHIITRPLLREFEIPYLGRSGARPEQQIPISDLNVSVRDGRILLRSARLGREVIPRLTSAHDFDGGGLGIYKFLCLLQYQGVAGELAWTWGALSHAPFLPRVVSGRLVLSPARWHITKEELQELDCSDRAARFRAIRSWRSRRRIPSLVFLSDNQSNLPVDFRNALSVESFAMLLRGREQATLFELFPTPEQTVARAPEGLFLHQLIIPFIKSRTIIKRASKSEKVRKKHASAERWQTVNCQRTFPPGSQWLYAKLYTGAATSDIVLRKVVRPMLRAAARRGAIDRWFFVRYGDPDWHLRLRVHGPRNRINSEVLPLLQSSIARSLKSKQVWRFQLDTYEREIERYGGAKGIVLSEKIFHADSEAVLTIIETLERRGAGPDERWQLAVCGIDMLLTDLCFDTSAKAVFMKRARDAFAREYRPGKKLRDQLGERFRKERKIISRLLEQDSNIDGTVRSCMKVLRGRSHALAGVVTELKSCEQAGWLSVSLEELALSYVHMHVNRLLRSSHREHELVIYDFLARHYDSLVAQKANSS